MPQKRKLVLRSELGGQGVNFFYGARMTLQSHGLERCLETARVNDKVVNKAARRPITSLSGAIFWFQHDPLWSCIRMDDHIVGIGPRTNSFCPPQTTWFKWQSCSNVRTFSFESRAFRPCGLHSVSFLLVPLSCYRLVMQHQDLLPVSTVFLSKPICSIHRTQQTQTQVLCSLIVLISDMSAPLENGGPAHPGGLAITSRTFVAIVIVNCRCKSPSNSFFDSRNFCKLLVVSCEVSSATRRTLIVTGSYRDHGLVSPGVTGGLGKVSASSQH